MTFEADQIIDRRNLMRALTFWRFVAIVALGLAIAIGYSLAFGLDHLPGFGFGDQIARVKITGYISHDRQRDKLFEKLAETAAIKAVVVSIDSTGGATTGGETLYESLRKLAERKPTVATVGTAGTAAAYIAAIATDHVVARRTSITGSIGVQLRYPEVSELIDKLGIGVEEIASSPLKADPRFKPISPMAQAVLSGVVNDSHEWLIDIFSERRGLDHSEARELADGRVFTGRQALLSGLIDGIGGEKEAIDWLVAERNINAELPVKEWKPKRSDTEGFSNFNSLFPWIAQRAGLLPNRFGTVESLSP